MTLLTDLSRRFTWILAALALVAAMGGTWMTSATANASPADALVRRPDARPSAAPTTAATPTRSTTTSGTTTSGTTTGRATPSGIPGSSTGGAIADDEPVPRKKRAVSGTLNLNTATEDQLMLLPQIGPAKAERIVTWRRKNGGFKRTADLRRVKGFGYKTFKRLEPLLDIRGETSLAPK